LLSPSYTAVSPVCLAIPRRTQIDWLPVAEHAGFTLRAYLDLAVPGHGAFAKEPGSG
jgi:hypothetical protein